MHIYVQIKLAQMIYLLIYYDQMTQVKWSNIF
jgi:hypothetical protein